MLSLLVIAMMPSFPIETRAQTPSKKASYSAVPDTAAPDTSARSSIFFEYLGNGILYSLNYDRKLTNHFSGRIGINYWVWSLLGTTRAAQMPVLVNYLAGWSSHRFELGVGINSGVIWEEGDRSAVFLPTAALGYRYQPPGGGWLFRINFTPFYSFAGDTFQGSGNESGPLAWFGVSIGRTW